MTRHYGALSVLKEGLTGQKGWTPAWRHAAPQRHYDAIVIGGGGHGLSLKNKPCAMAAFAPVESDAAKPPSQKSFGFSLSENIALFPLSEFKTGAAITAPRTGPVGLLRAFLFGTPRIRS